MIARVTLNNSQQDRDEPIRAFCARLRGQANICKYKIECPECNHEVDYTEPILRDVICRGIEDSDIQLDLLGQTNQDMSLDEVLHFVEARETGKRSATKLLQHHECNSIIRSSYRKNKLDIQPQTHPQTTCTYCGEKGHGEKSTARQRKKDCPAYNKVCGQCNRLHHFQNVCRSKDRQAKTRGQKTMEITNQGAVFNELCSIQSSSNSTTSHHVFNKPSKKWQKRQSSSQPFIDLTVAIDDDGYRQLGHKLIVNHPLKTIAIPAMADTGCQSCLVGFRQIQQLGLTKKDLIPVSMRMCAANGRTSFLSPCECVLLMENQSTS